MGTHPIFESDFDCLTEIKVSKMINFVASELSIEKSTKLKSKPEKRGFFAGFTDQMLEIDFDTLEGGWGKPKIRQFGPLSLHPAHLQASTRTRIPIQTSR